MVASQNWCSAKTKIKAADVSEGESFLWTGKTTHILKQLKPNEIRKVVLKAVIPREGIYNLNRFQINIKQTKNTAAGTAGDKGKAQDFLISEFKLKDLLMAKVVDGQSEIEDVLAPGAPSDSRQRLNTHDEFVGDLGKI